MSTRRGSVRLPVSAEALFAYLTDPHTRSQWQSSLDRVEEVTGKGEGQRWTDVTRLGLRARMETTVSEPPRRWSERGEALGFRGRLALGFEPEALDRCRVEIEVGLTGSGPRAWAAPLATYLAVPLVRSDLRRASRILSPPATPD